MDHKVADGDEKSRYPRRGLLHWIRGLLLACWVVIVTYASNAGWNVYQLAHADPAALTNRAALLAALALPGPLANPRTPLWIDGIFLLAALFLLLACVWATQDLKRELEYNQLSGNRLSSVGVHDLHDLHDMRDLHDLRDVSMARRAAASDLPAGGTSYPLARDLRRASFQLGDDAAADFPYVREPVQEAYARAEEALHAASIAATPKRGLLILGEANSGKTRLAYEVLTQALPDWPVFRWSPAYTVNHLPSPDRVRNQRLVVFIDDLRNRSGGLAEWCSMEA